MIDRVQAFATRCAAMVPAIPKAPASSISMPVPTRRGAGRRLSGHPKLPFLNGRPQDPPFQGHFSTQKIGFATDLVIVRTSVTRQEPRLPAPKGPPRPRKAGDDSSDWSGKDLRVGTTSIHNPATASFIYFLTSETSGRARATEMSRSYLVDGLGGVGACFLLGII